MTDQPLVSVLMTVYNRENVLASSIQSVLDSTYTNFELIIVDDCSTDNSYAIAQEFAKKDDRIKVYKNEKNLGDYPNRNRAASYAKGKYIKYNDSDEEMYYYGLKIMVECMEKYPDAPLGFSQIHDEHKMPHFLTSEEIYKGQFLHDKTYFKNAPSSSMIRRKEFEAEGGFNEIRHRGDYDLWLRMAAKYPVLRLPAFIGWNYIHEGQELSKNHLHKKSLTHNLSMKALYSEHCPLKEEDRLAAIEKWRKGFIRLNVFKAILTGKVNEAAYVIKHSDIKIKEILSAVVK